MQQVLILASFTFKLQSVAKPDGNQGGQGL